MALLDHGFAPGREKKNETTHPGTLRRLFQRFRPTISIASASNASPILVTTPVPHFLTAGQEVAITGVTGNTAANGTFTVAIPTDSPTTTFTLVGSSGNGDYAGGGSVVLPQRAHLVLEKKAGTVNEVITSLSTDTTVVKPIGNLLLGAHANAEGVLEIKLFRKQAYNEKKGQLTDFDSLEATLVRLPSPPNPPNTPDPARSIAVASNLLGPTPASPPHFVHLRGCNIGKSDEFMTEWKKALGGKVTVTAPKHFHGVVEVSPSLSDQYGSWEYYEYEFIVRRPAAVKGVADVPDRPHPIRTRQDLIDAFTAADPVTGDPRKFLDGTEVDPANWKAWIPETISRTVAFDVRNDLVGAATGRRGTVVVKRVLWVLPARFSPTPITYPNEFATEVPPLEEREDALKQHLLNDAGHSPSRFTPEHPFPMYRRLGYQTLEDMIEGYTWNLKNVTPLKKGKRQLVITGARVSYTLIIPITAPNPGPKLDEGKLIYNFFPNEGSPHPAIIQIRQDDQSFFGIA